jgi:hypothetical protein
VFVGALGAEVGGARGDVAPRSTRDLAPGLGREPAVARERRVESRGRVERRRDVGQAVCERANVPRDRGIARGAAPAYDAPGELGVRVLVAREDGEDLSHGGVRAAREGRGRDRGGDALEETPVDERLGGERSQRRRRDGGRGAELDERPRRDGGARVGGRDREAAARVVDLVERRAVSGLDEPRGRAQRVSAFGGGTSATRASALGRPRRA